MQIASILIRNQIFMEEMTMKFHQKGFGGLQAMLVMAVMVGISMVAIPAYNSFMMKAKITEAVTMAGESKRKVSEFYTLNGRFPQSASEAQTIKTVTVTAPEYVREMVVDTNDDAHAVVIKVYLKDGVVANPTGQEQFIFMAANHSGSGGDYVEWSCGANGLDAELMPESCKG